MVAATGAISLRFSRCVPRCVPCGRTSPSLPHRRHGLPPLRWTVDGLRPLVQRLAPLVVDRGLVPERGVPTMRVVPPLEILEDDEPRFGLRLEATAVEELAFERRKEALAEGIVVRVADGSHRR